MSAKDRIRLTGLRAVGHHGVLEHERQQGQEFLVDVDLLLDLSAAGASDDLEQTVNYAEVAAQVIEVITGEPLDLIETVATRICEVIIADHDLVQVVGVTVHKPQAPVGVPFGDVSVSIQRRRSVPVVIALGSNLPGTDRSSDQTSHRAALGPAAILDRAVRRLRRTGGLAAIRESARYRTDPVGGPEQPEFVNAVVLARTSLPPAALLTALHRIEDDFGREREVRWGPRTLDLDLIQYGTPGEPDERTGDTAALRLPHPRAHERAFVLVPWLDVDPASRLRTADGRVRTVAELARGLDLSGVGSGDPREVSSSE